MSDEVLGCIVRAGRAYFLYEPGFYAGSVTFSVSINQRMLASGELEVEPNLLKLTQAQYIKMISDISIFTKDIFRLSKATVPASTSFSSKRNIIVTLELLKANFDKLYASILRIKKQPLKSLKSNIVTSDIFSASNLSERSIDDALGRGKFRPATIRERLAAPALTAALNGQWLSEIRENRPYETGNVYENSAILGFLRWLSTALARISVELSSGRIDISEHTREVWSTRVRNWKIRVAELLRLTLFDNVSAVAALRSTSAFRLHPDYSAAYTAMSRIRAGFGDLAAYSPKFGIDQTPRLYELWCYLGLLNAALDRFPSAAAALTDTLRSINGRQQIVSVVLDMMGQGLRLSDNITLSYQPRFTKSPRSDGARTHLIDCVPDIVITKNKSTGECVELAILDPKYRIGISLLDGIRDLHAYRDAIVDSAGRRLTTAAVVLAPQSGNDSGAIPTDQPSVWLCQPPTDKAQFSSLFQAVLDVLADSSKLPELTA
ncbi:DUF2357 domain-containing protein [Rhizobium leguminosarum]|uniref:DUF2357 domain-containing protein n=1 Tax=Rhizobium leguminosarum TaxID=384 RepID=UPI001C94AF50|nr:DUF2357 domain-containing protein [Rhizobium leguminosarum]MBY5473597.1 DUF2357 domain-containing protein [Rhizobium leguminosarum]